MSIRAHRVIKIEYEKTASFNVSHDEKLRDFFDTEYNFLSSLNDDCCGMVELPVEALEQALQKVEMEDDVREALKKDIQAANEAGEEYVQYDCF
jgi:hypothetical protein